MSSITASTGRIASGADEIQNRPRNPAPCFTKPRMVTNRNTASARTAVTAMCEVVVNPAGISPRKFENTMKRNSVKM